MTIKEVRNRIFCRDGNKCYICGSDEMLCLDHLLPKPKFQIHKVNNLMTLCLKCNFKKGSHPLSEEEFCIREKYIINANKIFTNDDIYIMDSVLNDYFTTDGRPKKKKPNNVLRKNSALRHFEEHIAKQK